MAKTFNLQSGIFTLLSVGVAELAEDKRAAKAVYKVEANGVAGKIILNDRCKLKPARAKDTLHGYVIRNDKRVFEIFYNVVTSDIECKVL